MTLPIPNREILSVSAFNKKVKRALTQQFGLLWVSGEISNMSRPASGHIYFSLKDSDNQIRCAMFRSRNHPLNFKPENGMEIIVHARLDLYTVRGDLQLIVETMEVAGEGELRRQFEALKSKLFQEGLFDQEKKLALPSLPRHIGVITSLHGAALKDILRTLKNKSFPLDIVVYPTVVQGEHAPASICRALQTALHKNESDVILLARGGGNFEDLQAFNNEQLVRMIAASAIPIIAGIGHDIDFTLADFAADLRAATPTAAAHAIGPDTGELIQTLKTLRLRIQKSMHHTLITNRQNTKILLLSLKQHNPLASVENLLQRLDGLTMGLGMAMQNLQNQYAQSLASLHTRWQHNSPLLQISHQRNHVEKNQLRLSTSMEFSLSACNTSINRYATQLQALSPLAVLKRGFSITTTKDNKIIRDSRQSPPGTKVKIRLGKGSIDATVEANHKK